MTDTLQWRDATELRLTGKLIPNPSSTSDLLAHLSSIRVAIDGAFIHIDPRPTNGQVPVDTKAEYPVYVVPAAAVEVLTYRVVPKTYKVAGFS